MLKNLKGKLLLLGAAVFLTVVLFLSALIFYAINDMVDRENLEQNFDVSSLPAIITTEMIIGAMESEEKYGVPASLILAQIIQESSGSYPGGLSLLAYECHNLFGIKGIGPAGSKQYWTMEQAADGSAYRVLANFRKYNSVKESIDDHGQLLSSAYYMQYVSGAGKDANLWARGIHEAGYATDVNYSDNLIQLMNTYNLYQFNERGKGQNGDGIAHGNFVWPTISASVITSYYGFRDAPTEGASTFHEGIDIAPLDGMSGAPVYAADGGTVSYAGSNNLAGNYIVIDHGQGIETRYLHLRADDGILVRQGMKVSRGQMIGLMGSTGISTGNHLDFRIYIRGNSKNPLDYIQKP